MLEDVNKTLGASPVPASEWPALQRVLGGDLLARLLRISTVSLCRCLSGARRTPDDVAVRLPGGGRTIPRSSRCAISRRVDGIVHHAITIGFRHN